MDPMIPLGTRNIDMQNKSKEFNNDLIRQIQKAMLNISPFHDTNLDLLLEITGFHIDKQQGLALRGNLRYLTGKVSL